MVVSTRKRYPKVDVRGKSYFLLWETTVAEYDARGDANAKWHADRLRRCGHLSNVGLRRPGGMSPVYGHRRADGTIILECGEG